MYKFLIRPILFKFNPEKAHNITFSLLKIAQKIPGKLSVIKFCFEKKHPKLETEVFGIKFPNPIGLAAGLDKDSEAFDILGALGFGFVEIGTVTPKAQDGNPKPRMFRLRKNKALINRMGFNNKGVDFSVNNLKKRKTGIIIGGNIGKNKITDNENATEDYLISFEKLFNHVDYFVVNVSSPNTPDLRKLQDKEPLTKLLSSLQNSNQKKTNPKPILLKIAPDMSFSQIDEIIEIVQETKISGIVASNTTITREALSYSAEEIETFGAGGLSGSPVKNRSTEIVKYISEKTNRKLPIIAVGGIMTAEDAIEKLEAGANLVQIYTGFIYEGPALIKRIKSKIISS